ncbi:MAG: decaprenyl-phosphate phosphoribosyltransferase [Acidimicrobiia bacterium]|nr:decaprenyl-phosphate phosphoribosyltransferase [Acidimicrobiia bacterium]
MTVAFWRALRPSQWSKNVLVVLAPAAAGVLDQADVVRDTALMFVAFSLAASAGYLVNDLLDLEADRAHPIKRHRPIAAGEVPVAIVPVGAAVLAGAALAVTAPIRTEATAVIAVYLVTVLAYSFGLKRVPYLELVIVASGFVLRAVGGAAAADVPISIWFAIVVSSTAVFVVVAKRESELTHIVDAQRPVLSRYRQARMINVELLAIGSAALAHAGWALDGDRIGARAAAAVLFLLALLRYRSRTVDGPHGEDPVAVVLRDPVLLVLGAAWAAAVVVSVSA